MKVLTSGMAAAIIAATVAVSGCTAQSGDTPTAVSPSPVAAPTPTASPDASASAPAPSGSAQAAAAYVDYADGAIEATPGAKALFFHASWCPQCRALDGELRAQGAPDGLTVFKVDYDSRTDLRQKYGVTLQTTVVFVDDTGQPISTVVLYDNPSVASLAAAIP